MLSFFNSKKTYIVDTNQKIIKFTNFFLVKSTFLAIISSFLQILYLINLPLLLIKFAFSKKNMPKKNQKIEHLNVAYLRTTDSYNLRSGGSLGHTLGILDGFNDLVNNIHFFGIDKLQDINKDIKSTIFRPSRFLNYVNISNRLIFSQYFFNKLKNYFSSNNYDIIYQRLSRDDISGALLSRFFKIPLIVEYNSSMSWEVKNSSFFIEKIFIKITKILEKIMLNQASIIIAVSSVLKDELEKKGYNNVFVVTNGVNANIFKANNNDLKSNLKIDKNQKIVCFSGSFGFWHGVDIMEEAINKLNEQNINCHFLMVGDGFYRNNFEKKMKGAKNITFTGNVDYSKIVDYLSIADIFLSPHNISTKEKFIGSPTKLFEYMSIGKIIIASHLDQISEILYPSLKISSNNDLNDFKINAEDTGITVKPGDSILLGEVIKFTLKNYESLKHMGANARLRAKNYYTWNNKVKEILKHLNNYE